MGKEKKESFKTKDFEKDLHFLIISEYEKPPLI